MTGILSAIPSSEWIDRHFHSRPIPKGCRLVLRSEVASLPQPARSRAERVVSRHPRVRKIIVRL